MSIAELVNDFKKNNSMLWVENDKINLFVSDGFKSQELRDTITNLKSEIIEFLTYNKIFSKEDFQKKTIFASNLNEAILSFAQERLWFIEQYESGTSAYHIPLVYELAANTNIQGVKYAIQRIISRHEVLRSTIDQKDVEVHGVQIVRNEPLTIEEVALTSNDDYKSLLREDINCPFDLKREYPIRAKFYTIQSGGATSTILLINTHHIASDGWSTDILQKELSTYYEKYNHGDIDFCLPAMEIQYKDYAIWQRTYLTGEILAKQLNYWKNRLSGYQTLELPVDFARPNQVDYKGAHHWFALDKPTSQKLRSLTQRHGTTLHSVMLSGLSILLGKCTGQEDILVGSPTANRQRMQTEGLIGFFVNTQVNRTLLSSTQSFEVLIRQVHQNQVEAQLHQDLPFEKLVEELGVQRDVSRHPIFQVLFSVQNFGNQGNANNYLRLLPVETVYQIEKFDLSIFIEDGKEEITGYISYAISLFHKESIERFIDRYIYLLTKLTDTPEKTYSQISLLSPEDHKRIVYQWNETSKDFPKDRTISQLFQEQAERNPGGAALVYEGQCLTYNELNEWSNQLAHHIRARYYQRMGQHMIPDTLIALYLDRGPEMLIGILAILKAGGAYVPIDIDYPQDRIDYILEDTEAEFVLSQEHLSKVSHTQLPQDKTIFIDPTEKLYKEEDASNLPKHSDFSNLAYVIYTSGTTGKPKGVMVEHGAIISLVYNNYIKVEFNDVFAFLSSPTFDASTFEIWTPLLKGNLLVIPKDLKNLASDIKEFTRFLSENKVSIIWLTKTLFESLYHSDSSIFKDLNYLLIGGEALERNTVNKLIISSTKPRNFLNGYGPTESTTFTCTYDLKKPIDGFSVPIGKPINNRSIYVLDRNTTPVPIGVIGELYIGGAGLARGYLKHADLTRERFIPNIFATERDRLNGYSRLYKTGDLVRWLPDGNLEFIGRNDSQVKIRGYRIELGEIEQVLSQIKGVKQCCVLAKERKTELGNDKYLAAYYIFDNNDDLLAQSTILDKLSQALPEYMVPNVLVEMESFPLTINGKLDKRALPDPDFRQSAGEYVAPATDQEVELCGIWQEVLGIDRVGITDDFFRVGGNSILAIQVSHRMSKSLGCEIRVADVFRQRTIKILLSNVSLLQVDEENIKWKF